MANEVVTITPEMFALARGELKALKPEQQAFVLGELCKATGLNPAGAPFDFLWFNGKLNIYPNKGAASQLRAREKASVRIVSKVREGDVYTVTAQLTTPDGRTEEGSGAVSLLEWDKDNKCLRLDKQGNPIPLRGLELANAMMKAESKAKRRVTLDAIGLGLMDAEEAQDLSYDRNDGFVETPPPTKQTKQIGRQPIRRGFEEPVQTGKPEPVFANGQQQEPPTQAQATQQDFTQGEGVQTEQPDGKAQPVEPEKPAKAPKASLEQMNEIAKLSRAVHPGQPDEVWQRKLREQYRIKNASELTQKDADLLLMDLRELVGERQSGGIS